MAKVNASGKLLVSGNLKESEHVLFTSLDDQAIPPSVYNAPDLTYSAGNTLPNIQILRRKLASDLLCGVKYGDWGRSDGTPAGSYGGIYLTNPANAVINNLDLKYGLLF